MRPGLLRSPRRGRGNREATERALAALAFREGRRVCGLAAGGRWIRTCSTAAREPAISDPLGSITLAMKSSAERMVSGLSGRWTKRDSDLRSARSNDGRQSVAGARRRGVRRRTMRPAPYPRCPPTARVVSSQCGRVNVGEQPGLDRGGRALLLRMIAGETAGLVFIAAKGASINLGRGSAATAHPLAATAGRATYRHRLHRDSVPGRNPPS